MWCSVLHPGYNYPAWFVSYLWVFLGVCSFRPKLCACKPPPVSLYNPEPPHCSQQTVFPEQCQTPAELSTGLWPKQGCKWIYWPQHFVHGWKRNLTKPSLVLCLSLALLMFKNLPLLPRKKFHWRWEVQMKKRCILKAKVLKKNFVNISRCFFAWRV